MQSKAITAIDCWRLSLRIGNRILPRLIKRIYGGFIWYNKQQNESQIKLNKAEKSRGFKQEKETGGYVKNETKVKYKEHN